MTGFPVIIRQSDIIDSCIVVSGVLYSITCGSTREEKRLSGKLSLPDLDRCREGSS